MTVSISDMTVPPEKPQIRSARLSKNYKRGLITEEERYKEVVETWKATDDKLTDALLSGLDKYNNIYMMADSGARGSDKPDQTACKVCVDLWQIRQDVPSSCRSNRTSVKVLTYWNTSCQRMARKGLSDTALRTADSGYLTRRLVDVSQQLIIHDADCVGPEDEIPGMYVHAFTDGNEEIESLQDRITGRFSCEDIKDGDGNVIVKKNHMITPPPCGTCDQKKVWMRTASRSAESRSVRSLPAAARTVSARSATEPTWRPEKSFRSERQSVSWRLSPSESLVHSLPGYVPYRWSCR